MQASPTLIGRTADMRKPQMKQTRKFLDSLLKDGRKADAIECALVASAVILTVVAIEATLINRISHEFNMITDRF
jgi:Flp pilus assembly pilin Flp